MQGPDALLEWYGRSVTRWSPCHQATQVGSAQQHALLRPVADVYRSVTLRRARRRLAAEYDAWQRRSAQAVRRADLRTPPSRPALRTEPLTMCGLTARQLEVARLIASGCTNAAIAERLVVTRGTAANHVAHILERLKLTCRAQVAVWAVQHGLLLDSQPTAA